MKKEILDILLKEYDVMRDEIRLYINKVYLAATGIIAIISVGIFKQDQIGSNFTIILIPYLISFIGGYMIMVSFFIHKAAGYVSLIEERINRMFGTSREDIIKNIYNKPLPLMLWESFYADIGIERDIGKQAKSDYALAIALLLFLGLLMMLAIVIKGCIAIDNIPLGVLHFIASFASLLGAGILFCKIETKTRMRMRNINNELLNNYIPVECENNDTNGEEEV